MPRLNWKILTKQRGTSTPGIPHGKEVQTIGPLKTLAGGPAPGAAEGLSSHRFLIVSDVRDASRVVLRQASNPSPP